MGSGNLELFRCINTAQWLKLGMLGFFFLGRISLAPECTFSGSLGPSGTYAGANGFCRALADCAPGEWGEGLEARGEREARATLALSPPVGVGHTGPVCAS